MKQLKNEANEQKGGFFSMLLGTLGASLLRNLFKAKVVKQSKLPGRGVMRAGEGTTRTGQPKSLMMSHPLTNFEIHKYYQNEFKFNGVYSRNSLPTLNDGAYEMSSNQQKLIA